MRSRRARPERSLKKPEKPEEARELISCRCLLVLVLALDAFFFPIVRPFDVPWNACVSSVTARYLHRYVTFCDSSNPTLLHLSTSQMGSQRLTLAEKQIHLRMRRLGYSAKQIVEATGNSSASVYRSFNKADNGHALMPAPSHQVGRPRKLNNDDIEVTWLLRTVSCTL
jgi:hypothetical protein